MLATEIECARRASATLGVALIDVDGFRLLNDNHGHARRRRGTAVRCGSPSADDRRHAAHGPLRSRRVPHRLARPRRRDAPRRSSRACAPASPRPSLQFESTERLPVTVSAGLCTYPLHGSSVTTLLSTAVRTLEEAKAGGGDTVRVAQAQAEHAGETAAASSFDVLKGLVIAVDTKDRYTKRHSEDVARYALFIAARLGLDEDALRTLQVAGLLHDVGKIGIPDDILRKPGRLTAAETAVIQQHVALGDTIVRELPDIDTVRAGIRHHHERWDGRGYLAGLSGERHPAHRPDPGGRRRVLGDDDDADRTARRLT